MLALKLEQLRSEVRSYGSCVVAYSGGVDSVFLSAVAHDVLGDSMVAVIADSPSLPRQELREALDLAASFRFPVEVIKTGEFENAEYLKNPANRCYFCKHELFTRLIPFAKSRGYAAVLYGENASDVGDYRPGAQAAMEFQVLAPLKKVGLTKAEIRELSAGMGLPTHDKPEAACLSSRVPYGERVTPEKLRIIELAEACLKQAGCHDVRLRLHEMAGSYLGRIELGNTEFAAFMTRPDRLEIHQQLKALGMRFVTVDLGGYRRGSLNDVIPLETIRAVAAGSAN